MKKFYNTFLTASLLLSLAQAQRTPLSLGFKNGNFATEKNLLLEKNANLLPPVTQYRHNYYVLLHFDKLPGSEERNALASRGVLLFDYLPGNSFMAEISDSAAISTLQNNHVIAIYHVPPALKMLRGFNPLSELDMRDPHSAIAVGFFGTIRRDEVISRLVSLGARLFQTKLQPDNAVFIKATPGVISKIAELPFVSYISQQQLQDIALNYNNRAMHALDALSAPSGRNLLGRNVTMGIGDDADPSSHIDFAGRLIQRNPATTNFHGTHTAGTMAGGGILNPKNRGMAPLATIVSQYFSDILVNASIYKGDFNMVLTNNSYFSGLNFCPGEGEYDPLSNFTDAQLSANPGLLHVFAVGNDGTLTCSPYLPYVGTIKSGFQCAKDVLTVGAVDNTTYNLKFGSSRGPVLDGRIKPEIMAGGANILSTIPNNGYGYSSGTSMSSPTVTGTLGLLFERFRQLHGGTDPSAALIKAVACNSADDMGNPGPDFTFGFGMLNARTSVETIENNQFFTGTLSNGGLATYSIMGIPAGMQQIKIMLYWTDPAAAAYASSALVNNLDLTVTAPGAITHLPLILDPTPSNVNNNAVEGVDNRNNIEQVVINNPPAGDFTVTIHGTSIPIGPQDYVIAYQLIKPSVTVEYPYGNETWVPGESEFIRWSDYGGAGNSFTIEFSADNGTTWSTISNNVPANTHLLAWTVPAIPTTQALIRVSCNNTALSGVSKYDFTILGQPLMSLTKACAGYGLLAWNTVPAATQYQILMLRGDSMQTIASTTDTSFLLGGLSRDSSYWLSVQAIANGVAGRRAIAANIIPNGGPCGLAAFNGDFSIDSLIAPLTGRQFTSSQLSNSASIVVEIKNLGSTASSSPVSVSYQVNGGGITTEIIAAPIAGNSSTNYAFTAPYDFSAAGSYSVKTWVSYSGDSLHANDTLTRVIKQLSNDTLALNPVFTEGFESAAPFTYSSPVMGFMGIDRCDFNAATANGRARTFVNTGFARTGNRCVTLDQVLNSAIATADSLIMTFNLSNHISGDQLWLDFYYKNQGINFSLPGNQVWIRGNDQAVWIAADTLSSQAADIGIYRAGKSIDITGTLAAASPSQTVSSSFQVKFGEQGFTSSNSVIPDGALDNGYSFDDISITHSANDMGVQSLVQPALGTQCNLSNAETISLLVKNYSQNTLTNVPVSYSVNGNIVTESIPTIAPGQTINYTFSKKADLSAFQQYNLGLWVSYGGDNYHKNDSLLNILFQTTPIISSYPYLEGFENNNGYWYTQGINDSWQWGAPAKTIINKAANGKKAWVTNLAGNYNDNELSYLYSPCFDLSSLQQPVLSFSHIFQTEDDCDCDYHWAEYSLDGVNWLKLGATGNGTNWYDNSSKQAWQLSYTKWHVSSFDIPVTASKVRFRIVMSSDPATNFEGVGIDDVHIFDKAPIYGGANISSGLTQSVSGSKWIDFEMGGGRVVSLNPNGQDLGNTSVKVYINRSGIRNSNSQYYLDRNVVIQTANPPAAPVTVRFYFLDSEANSLINATGCGNCTGISDAYESGVTQYSKAPAEEDSTLNNNISGTYNFILPRQQVSIIPHDKGYYAEYSVNGFSEFWINGGGPGQNQALPLSLQTFTATRVNAGALLQWTLTANAMIDSFDIEKSADGIHFVSIGQQAADTAVDSTTHYQFTDINLVKGINYYRLKLIESGGQFQYSPIRTIVFTDNALGIIVYPNPVTTGIVYIASGFNCSRLELYDASGRFVRGENVFGLQNTIPTVDLAKGVYILRIRTDAGTAIQKIVVD